MWTVHRITGPEDELLEEFATEDAAVDYADALVDVEPVGVFHVVRSGDVPVWTSEARLRRILPEGEPKA